jgi:hypothetical protein
MEVEACIRARRPIETTVVAIVVKAAAAAAAAEAAAAEAVTRRRDFKLSLIKFSIHQTASPPFTFPT